MVVLGCEDEVEVGLAFRPEEIRTLGPETPAARDRSVEEGKGPLLFLMFVLCAGNRALREGRKPEGGDLPEGDGNLGREGEDAGTVAQFADFGVGCPALLVEDAEGEEKQDYPSYEAGSLSRFENAPSDDGKHGSRDEPVPEGDGVDYGSILALPQRERDFHASRISAQGREGQGAFLKRESMLQDERPFNLDIAALYIEVYNSM